MADLEQLTKQYNSVLEDYKRTYNDFIRSLSVGSVTESDNQYGSKLQKLNQLLMEINKEINSHLEKDYTKYKSDYAKQQSQTEFVENNYFLLKEDRKKIKQLARENAFIDKAAANSEITVTQHHTYYTCLLLLTLMLVCILMKSKTSNRNDLVGGSFRFFKR